MIFGVVLAVQFRSTIYSNRQKSSAAFNAERLRAEINNEMRINNELRSEIEEQTVKREKYLKSLIENKNDYEMLEEWDRVMLKAGLTDVKGAGITIKLDDAAARQGENPELLIIHDNDIRQILNELKKAGAQAISINGERIVATSEQVCAGPTILINRNRHAVPYTINAIGDPDLLFDTLSRCERIAIMIEDKIRIDIKKSKGVYVPHFSNIDKLNSYISGLEVVGK